MYSWTTPHVNEYQQKLFRSHLFSSDFWWVSLKYLLIVFKLHFLTNQSGLWYPIFSTFFIRSPILTKNHVAVPVGHCRNSQTSTKWWRCVSCEWGIAVPPKNFEIFTVRKFKLWPFEIWSQMLRSIEGAHGKWNQFELVFRIEKQDLKIRFKIVLCGTQVEICRPIGSIAFL